FSNWFARGRLGRWLHEKLFGIDRRRVPPRFARSNLVLAWLYEGSGPVGAAAAEVLLFPDTFALYYEPPVGLAAPRVLGGVAYTPRLGMPVGGFPNVRWPGPPNLRCCGRPLISNGMLDQAVDFARQNVEQLYPWAAAGKPITACEPSCILTIKDDYPALLRGELRRQAEVVAAACRTFEECVAAAPPRTPPSPQPERILVQSHCHQRALVGVTPLLQMLQVPGGEVIDLDAGCCGMAGSFGYEKEHYEVSRLVGEQRLFPAIRSADAQARIVAPGFSCRMQILH